MEDSVMITTVNKGYRVYRNANCPDCRSKLKFEAEDVVCVNTAMKYAGENWEPRYKIVCPECGEDIYVGNKINAKMKQDAEDRLKSSVSGGTG
jgi:hypothetical protein